MKHGWLSGVAPATEKTSLMSEEPRIALLVIDHGSRQVESNMALDQTVREVQTQCAGRYVVVLAAHMDVLSPSIGEAFDAAVAAGAIHVVAALYLLAPGRHAQQDVPRLLAEAAERHPGVGFTVTDALGPDPMLAELVLRRAEKAWKDRNF